MTGEQPRYERTRLLAACTGAVLFLVGAWQGPEFLVTQIVWSAIWTPVGAWCGLGVHGFVTRHLDARRAHRRSQVDGPGQLRHG